MDTCTDFIQPEFLNIVFFQQKNLVVFPYVDLKHLHGLEIFTAGYNVVDLESTALHNLKEILEFESTNSYSQSPTLYFIYNVDREKVKELMELDGIRCIINSNENISNLANGSNFIFYNKKNNQFFNYDRDKKKLEFEQTLITNSQDEDILQEHIQKIKIAATRIFKELNQNGSLESLPDILNEYEQKYWPSILEFTSRYYDINIPDISTMKFKPRKEVKDFSGEYEVLISTNRALGKEFIQLLHEYRSKKVNPAHLELDELYNPQKLYNYLRNHHWKDGIPQEFIEEWHEMNISDYELTESDQYDFQNILKKLNIEQDNLSFSYSDHTEPITSIRKKQETVVKQGIPSLQDNWRQYKSWLLSNLDNLEQSIDNIIGSESSHSKLKSYLFEEIAEIIKIINNNRAKHKNEISKASNKTVDNMNNELLIVDITNILNKDKDVNGALKIENIILVRRDLISRGYKPVMIADANMRHYTLNEPHLYEMLIEKKVVLQSPAGKKADEYILDIAKAQNCKFLTNDMYREYWDEFGKQWIFNRRLTGMIFNGKLSVR